MKMAMEQTLRHNRRRFLAVLLVAPLLLYEYPPARKNTFPGTALRDSSDCFVIVNGWVLLTQDIGE